MLEFTGGSTHNCEGIHRRTFLKIGALGLAGLTLPNLLRWRAAASAVGKETKDTAVILLWLGGGPSQFETYDPKPQAPVEYRGPFQPIATRLPGVHICELLPRQAQILDKMAIIRSCAHKESGHGSAVKNLNTGYLHPPNTNEGSFLYPAVGAIVAKVREQQRRQLPNYVCIPSARIFKDDIGGGAYLGPAYDPFAADPREGPKALMLPAELSASRLENRRKLLADLDRLRRDVDASGMMEGMDAFTRQAFEMVTGKAARDALDLSQEPAQVREKYGLASVRRGFPWGQGCLLARRLVEAGVSFVAVGLEGWDDHGKIKDEMLGRAAAFDAAVASLVEDLYARGLDKKVLVLIWGEFGRTPRINKDAGRDHWPSSMSVVLAGGGLKMGQVIGSTDDKGEKPKDRPLHPNDVLATVYRHLGIDITQAFINPAGRPIPILPHGEPIEELF
ncbi:MAG: DUF1501 domain-containing protein [Gemmatales bacterium]|nr:DUF1501 domain-containing protein [Gemmatales bacterium]MCS7161690.1 DUF1501 domain-containing protein [Gemmatales bacterium]MDW8176893.1 DUF1501 domain-containing protein [Gemmatales bacterium]MDW8222715.1 DUF1501 domain-containing protein [Gemmatales bacterium]